ncbi:MAG: bifunctional diaminohydroxyphosphoribosylaminopyrimidine deaminase/5-amino-6-(5-phosphoribosylamino)uracil reductase RibD [Bacteroidota bacterium]|nr:bifunctional diaminohydroxyphosphoribosylaminopyrimidine deaminase/5-amino-6-(5-phosphoribosylamino)uracil reductase RibD [Bacteroidota bacterium]
MNRCFQLASLGAGNVAPNPLVGAVLVHNGHIISEGYHHKFGDPHAEVMALKNVTDPDLLAEATLYVNLEPCSHTGKTPPCASLIIEKGIKEVIISNQDPYPKVNGSGILQLQQAGVKVIKGILEKEGALLNRRFFIFHKKKRPYILLKWAQTKNGFMAPLNQPDKSEVTWISNAYSRMLVHQWRSEEQAILVGKLTALADNPELNVRGISGNSPVRIVIDPELSLPKDLHVFNNNIRTYIFNFVKEYRDHNTYYIKLPNTNEMLPELLKVLFEENIQSVLIEGGAVTLGHFINRGIWDEARIFTGKTTFTQGMPAPVINGVLTDHLDVAGDELEIYFNQSVI